MRDFGTMKDNVGTDVQDTSTAMSTIIGRYINKRYLDILRLSNSQIINHTAVASLMSGLATLPTDFGKELYVAGSDGMVMQYMDFAEASRNSPLDEEQSGIYNKYTIFIDSNGNKQIKVFDETDYSDTVNIPYIVRPTALSNDTDTPLIAVEDAIEAGAIADCWRYKRQGAKAQSMEVMYQDLLSNFIWDNENQQKPRQFTPTTYSRDNL